MRDVWYEFTLLYIGLVLIIPIVHGIVPRSPESGTLPALIENRTGQTTTDKPDNQTNEKKKEIIREPERKQ